MEKRNIEKIEEDDAKLKKDIVKKAPKNKRAKKIEEDI